jgi:D-beta-D-heptose 7-phosphate kinase/D-beta-D-heptose 1-phosphate adenosyltransferase
LGRFCSSQDFTEFAGQCHRAGRVIVFTNGCFDLLHPGHIRLLEQSRSLGDVLLVATNSDASIHTLKGGDRPIMPQAERAELLAALEAVDAVTVFDELTPQSLIAAVLPGILVKGGDWADDQIVGRAEVEAAGGRVVSVPLLPGYSTSGLVAQIRQTS